MHVRGKVGLSIDYWKKRRLAAEDRAEEEPPNEDTWRVLIEVQEIPAHEYNTVPSVRVSNNWVSDEVKKPK